MPNDRPYWIIDGYYYQIDVDNLDNTTVMRVKGKELASITDRNEYNAALDKIKKKIYYIEKNEQITFWLDTLHTNLDEE